MASFAEEFLEKRRRWEEDPRTYSFVQHFKVSEIVEAIKRDIRGKILANLWTFWTEEFEPFPDDIAEEVGDFSASEESDRFICAILPGIIEEELGYHIFRVKPLRPITGSPSDKWLRCKIKLGFGIKPRKVSV